MDGHRWLRVRDDRCIRHAPSPVDPEEDLAVQVDGQDLVVQVERGRDLGHDQDLVDHALVALREAACCHRVAARLRRDVQLGARHHADVVASATKRPRKAR